MKPLFDYSSYRKFLRDVFIGAKAANPKLNLGVYGQRLGLGRSTAKMVLAGKRRLTIQNVHAVARALRLSEAEHEYFEALVLRDQARSAAEKAFYAKRLKVIREKGSLSSVLVSNREVLEDPLGLGVLVYIRDILPPGPDGFSESYTARVAKAFQVDPPRIRGILQRLELAPAAGDGEETQFVFNPKLHRAHQKEYVKNWLRESASRVEREFDGDQSLFNVSSLSLSALGLEEFKQDLKSVIEKHMAESVGRDGEALVVQTCLGVFPVARREAGA